MSDEVTKPVSDQEVDTWISELTEADKAELRRQQLLSRAIAKADPKSTPNYKGMTNEEFHKETMDKFGF